MTNEVVTTSINTIRFLAVEAVQKANSGHPGLPLGAAPAAFELWSNHMSHNPKNPDWFNRDRFILSAGHGSALLYSLLHVFGYDVTVEDLKNFRQLGSKTPGHPEYGHTKGVEVTTGPLGQGIANAVGFAMAEAHMSAVFNRPDFEIVDHYTYALCGDGCLMEGISYEAASYAGMLKLGKLILLYDSNNITIEGSTELSFTEDIAKRFEACNWQVLKVTDGNDVEQISNAIKEAKAEKNKPTIIEIKTKIGFGSPNKQGKSSAHGEPLGEEEIKLTKQALGWTNTEQFHIPNEVEKYISEITDKLEECEKNWISMLNKYAYEYPKEYAEFNKWFSNDFSYLYNDEEFWNYDGDIATRVSSEQVLNKLEKFVPNLIGGSADLSPSTKTVMKSREYFDSQNYTGSNVRFGIREHAMTAIANGLALHGGLRCYISGFFIFSDYMKPAMRLSAMMKLPVISILTHDSIGVGEDGATHQPIEQLAALRSIPNFTVFRPCDSNETAAGWYAALNRTDSPTALILTRQNCTCITKSGKDALKGGYILRDSKGVPDVILMASGSEVELIYKAKDALAEKGIDARVVSMPSFEIFEEQTEQYKQSVLPKSVTKRVAVEAGSSYCWHKYVGLDGAIIAIDTFGASAPAELLFKKYGFTVENIVDVTLKLQN